jgi:hypothetical protein
MAETVVETTPVRVLTPFEEWSAVPDADQQLSSGAEIDTASATDPASEPETKVDDRVEEKLPKGLKKRFSALTTEIRELRAELAAKPGKSETGVATLPKVDAVADPGKPVAANFDTYEEYVEALTDWKIEQRDVLKAAVDAKANQASVVKTQVEAARARHDDYDQVVTDQVEITPAMAEVLVGSDHGAEIAYFLGSNPDQAARIAKLSPARAGAELAKIEASLNLSSTSTTTKAATSKAPTPPITLKGAGGGTDAEPDPKDFKKWNQWMDREAKRKAGA